MPKVNVYLDDDLASQVKTLRLPMSEICREALWKAVDRDVTALCKKCKQPASYHVRSGKGVMYACEDHLTLYLDGSATVRAI